MTPAIVTPPALAPTLSTPVLTQQSPVLTQQAIERSLPVGTNLGAFLVPSTATIPDPRTGAPTSVPITLDPISVAEQAIISGTATIAEKQLVDDARLMRAEIRAGFG